MEWVLVRSDASFNWVCAELDFRNFDMQIATPQTEPHSHSPKSSFQISA
uniref:Uncharacterized protein n=2 Tax=Anguilla anguilla TaxID=7936 RepID=A0A0E9S7I2_ANGAN